MNETIVVKDGQAAVTTTSVSGELSPKASATDIVTVVETPNGKQAALKVYPLNGGGEGGGADYTEEINYLNNAVSILATSVELSSEIGEETVVLLEELTAMNIDGRPSYKEAGATVYSEGGVVGIISSINNSAQTAVVVTVTPSAISEVGDIASVLDSINGEVL